MKTIAIITVLISVLFLASCWVNNTPMTELEQAEHYGMTLQEFREMKDAAARMNMSIDDHMKMTNTGGMWHWDMMKDTIKNPIIEEDNDDMMNH